MIGQITEKKALAFGITAIFTVATALGYTSAPPIPETGQFASSLIYGGLSTTTAVGVGGTAWAAGFSAGKILNGIFGTQKMDDMLGRIAGYGAGLAAAFFLTMNMAARAESFPVPQTKEGVDGIAEMSVPPPFTFDGKNTTYSLADSNTVEELVILETEHTSINLTRYDFSKGNVAYFKIHNNGDEINMVQIASRSFNQVASESVLHALVMGCKAAMETGLGDDNPHREMSEQYLRTYCRSFH